VPLSGFLYDILKSSSQPTPTREGSSDIRRHNMLPIHDTDNDYEMEDPLLGAPLDAVLDALEDDRTEFELASVTADMSYGEKAKAFAVARFPEDDLSKLIPGDPPDANFSEGKPSDQVDFETFKAYIEPYFRPFGEEDLAFLNERGDNVTPYIIPKLGKHYSLQWAEEDGAPVPYASPPPGTISSVVNYPNTRKGKSVERNDGQLVSEESIISGARTARSAELIEAQLPYQEYSTILEDLDRQILEASPKAVRVSKANVEIGELGSLIKKRKEWVETVGPFFEDNVTAPPDGKMFGGMEGLVARGEV
jgi:hypothetical protein